MFYKYYVFVVCFGVHVYCRRDKLWIAMEYCGGGSLQDIYHGNTLTHTHMYTHALYMYNVCTVMYMYNYTCHLNTTCNTSTAVHTMLPHITQHSYHIHYRKKKRKDLACQQSTEQGMG